MFRPFMLVHFIATSIVVAIWLNASAFAALNEPGLYSPVDNVVTLNSQTLEPALNERSMGKFVQFINIFCGHCRRFAPTFKNLSLELHKWRNLLSVYVVDCAKDENVKICRDFEIRKTPTLRFFKSNFKRSEHGIGTPIDSRKHEEILQILANEIANNSYDTTQANFEVIGPNANRDNIWQTNARVKYIVLVYQPKGSTIGRDTLLELLPYENIAVRIVEDEKLFANFTMTAGHQKAAAEATPLTHKVVHIDRNNETHVLVASKNSTEAYVRSIVDFLQMRGFTPVPPLPTTPAPNVTFTMDQEKQMILAHVLKSHLQIYRADLEQAIYKLLHIEIPKAASIDGDSLVALKGLTSWIASSKPLNENANKFLALLAEKINTQKELTGVQLEDLIKELEKQLPKIYKTKRDVGCISSRPFLRGFTCSLWTLFHYLTVQAAKTPNEQHSTSVLSAMHGFVKYFFGCEDCVNHFLDMAKRRQIDSPRNRDEDVLWLWKAHNEVNQRLANDSTEDPHFPKIQFPLKQDCPDCYSNDSGTWVEDNVLQFLKRIYDADNLSNFGYF